MSSPFSHVDHYFGRRFSKSHELFLAYLLASAREGHLCVLIENQELFPSCGELDSELIKQAQTLPELHVVVEQESRWYLRRSWEAEQLFLENFERLSSATVEPKAFSTEGLNAEQEAAIGYAMEHPVTLVSGGPGTGKTYTAAKLIGQFPKERVAVAAPTGKAAANLRASLPDISVQTLHALLKRDQQIDADLVVIDEGSMIDAELMARLFKAVKTGARLVLFGDKDQLPPVESGSLFADLSRNNRVELATCLRAELQEIIDVAQAVKQGKPVHYEPLPSVKELIPMIQNSSACILTPLRKGPYGVENLNALIHQGEEPVPIMVKVNDPTQELYNGDTGLLYKEYAQFGERKLPRYLLPTYEYAYVLSVHKSQGSEYDEVIVLLPQGSERFGREMLYTAVTRARKKLTLYVEEGELEKVLAKQVKRFSSLSSICTR